MSDAARTVDRTYLVLTLFTTLAASFIWGINTLFLLDAGLDNTQAFTVNAFFTVGQVLFEVPTGVVADTRGRRFSFLLGTATLLGSTLLYLWMWQVQAPFIGWAFASILLGLGFTFYSGAVEAWLVDALHATGFTDPVDTVLARGSFISSIAQLVGAVGGGLLGGISLAVPYLARCVLLVGAFVIAFFAMHDIGFTVRAMQWSDVPREMARVGRESVRFGWRNPHARLAMLAGAAPAVLLAWGYHAWQPYFTQLLGSSAPWVLGAIAAA